MLLEHHHKWNHKFNGVGNRGSDKGVVLLPFCRAPICNSPRALTTNATVKSHLLSPASPLLPSHQLSFISPQLIIIAPRASCQLPCCLPADLPRHSRRTHTQTRGYTHAPHFKRDRRPRRCTWLPLKIPVFWSLSRRSQCQPFLRDSRCGRRKVSESC